MPYAYSENGLSSRSVASDYVAADGEVVFDDIATDEQLAAAFATFATLKQREAIKLQIIELETRQTPRRVREAGADDGGGTAAGRAWMSDLNSQIATLRAQMTAG